MASASASASTRQTDREDREEETTSASKKAKLVTPENRHLILLCIKTREYLSCLSYLEALALDGKVSIEDTNAVWKRYPGRLTLFSYNIADDPVSAVLAEGIGQGAVETCCLMLQLLKLKPQAVAMLGSCAALTSDTPKGTVCFGYQCVDWSNFEEVAGTLQSKGGIVEAAAAKNIKDRFHGSKLEVKYNLRSEAADAVFRVERAIFHSIPWVEEADTSKFRWGHSSMTALEMEGAAFCSMVATWNKQTSKKVDNLGIIKGVMDHATATSREGKEKYQEIASRHSIQAFFDCVSPHFSPKPKREKPESMAWERTWDNYIVLVGKSTTQLVHKLTAEQARTLVGSLEKCSAKAEAETAEIKALLPKTAGFSLSTIKQLDPTSSSVRDDDEESSDSDES